MYYLLNMLKRNMLKLLKKRILIRVFLNLTVILQLFLNALVETL